MEKFNYGSLSGSIDEERNDPQFTNKNETKSSIYSSRNFIGAFIILGVIFSVVLISNNSQLHPLTPSITLLNEEDLTLGLSVEPPTMYPTVQSPTHYPTIFVPTTSSPTLQPITSEPSTSVPTTSNPTPTPGTPTLWPTDAAPTHYPTPTELFKSSEPTYNPTHGEETIVEDLDTLFFSSRRDGYEPLGYFEKDPDPILKYLMLDGYRGVVEPHADMYMHIYASEDTEYTYSYLICENNTETCVEDEYSKPFNFACTSQLTTFKVTVKKYESETHALKAESEGYFLCLYVRREFRALTPVDLNKTIDAMSQMWVYDEEEGQALFGENYHNYAVLLEYHYFNAAWQDSDHIHEGNGFLAQHIKMDIIFEKAMQAIDPSISLPYWDFTIENTTGVQVWESPLFTPQTFGTMNLPKDMVLGWTYANDAVEDGVIPDGKWAFLKAEKNKKYHDLQSNYGYMRAPWNTNPSNYITRFTSVDKYLPSCDDHYTLLSYSLLSDFNKEVPYAAHASVHGVLGGVYGCDLFDPLLDKGYIIDEQAKLNLCKNWIFYLKEFYRDNLITPRQNCTAANLETGEFSTAYEHQNCGFDCVPDMINILLLQLQRSVLNSDYDCVPDVDTMPTEGWVAWKEFICTGDAYKIFGGDHLESASPADPSFWPIHPTLERILQARFMSGGFDTDVWASDPVNEYVCNKATCYDPSQSLTDDIRASFSSWESCCYGHYQDDQLMDAVNGDRYSGVGPTNGEIYEWMNPTKTTYAMNYIYDSFTWSHCQEIGYDFQGLIEYQYYNKTIVNESAIEFTSEKGWR